MASKYAFFRARAVTSLNFAVEVQGILENHSQILRFFVILAFRMIQIFFLLIFWLKSANSNEVNYKGSTIKPFNVNATTVIVCFVWEEDSYFSTFQRISAAVELGMVHANRFIIPKTHKLEWVYVNANNSCAHTMYDVTSSFYQTMNSGIRCNMILGASK